VQVVCAPDGPAVLGEATVVQPASQDTPTPQRAQELRRPDMPRDPQDRPDLHSRRPGGQDVDPFKRGWLTRLRALP